MPVHDPNSIDIVAHNPKTDEVILVMVESREWGDAGARLPELQAKLNTYIGYALDGRLACDYPSFALKPIRIELQTQHPPSLRAQQFLDVVARDDFQPRGISFGWRLTR